MAQYFPHGIFNYDVCGGEHLFTQAEYNRLTSLNANYFSEMSPRAQLGMVDSCNNSSGNMRIQLGSDPTYDYLNPHLGPNYPSDHFDRNNLLWVYICDNSNSANIHYNLIQNFIDNIHTTYSSDYSGIDAIRVAHEGWSDDPNHWPFIRYAGYWIQQYFGDAVKSVAIHNIHHWTRSRLEDFFSNSTGVGDSLDVYQHEYYPFFDTNPAGPPYMGDPFQTTLLDNRYIASCESTRMHLQRSGNTHTTLEMHIQTFEARYGATYFRRPTEAEIWLQTFLALGRNYKGILAAFYRSDNNGGVDFETSLIDSLTRLPIQPIFNYVADLYGHLDILGPQILPLEVDTAFTWTGAIPPDYPLIQEITGYVLDGSHATIEVSLMDHPSNNYDYLMLVNRRCSSDNAGTPAPAQTITVRTNKSGQYQIRDLYSGELFVSSDDYFRNITIGPGRGRLFELRLVL